MKKKKSKLVLYKDKKREWRWRFTAANGQVLADSGEGYRRRIDCLDGFRGLFRICADSPEVALWGTLVRVKQTWEIDF